MKKNKGFTLIELLAVIVVLAIIALIATPIVLNLIKDAREGAAKSSATNYVKAVEDGIVAGLMDEPDKSYTGTFTVDSTGLKLINSENTEIKVDVSGTLPDEGSYITLNEKGKVESGYFTINGYNISYSNGKPDVIGDKVKREETLKLIHGIEETIDQELGLDEKYDYPFHCYLRDNQISCHYDNNVKLSSGLCVNAVNLRVQDEYSIPGECDDEYALYEEGDAGIASVASIDFDVSKYISYNVSSSEIWYNARAKKLAIAHINGFEYNDGILGSYTVNDIRSSNLLKRN